MSGQIVIHNNLLEEWLNSKTTASTNGWIENTCYMSFLIWLSEFHDLLDTFTQPHWLFSSFFTTSSHSVFPSQVELCCFRLFAYFVDISNSGAQELLPINSVLMIRFGGPYWVPGIKMSQLVQKNLPTHWNMSLDP